MRGTWWRALLPPLFHTRRRPRQRRTRLAVELLEDRLVPSTLDVWTGAAGDNEWTTAGNWASGVPTAGDIAQFTGTGGTHANDSVTIAASQTLDGIEIDAGYTGTITDNADLVLSSGFAQAGGTFSAGSSTISVAGDWSITGGTFDAATGAVVFDGAAQNLTNGGTALADLTHSGTGTLTLHDTLAVTGTLTNGSNTLDLNGHTLTAASTVVNGGTLLVDGSFSGSVTVSSPGTLAGTGTLTGNVSGTGTVAPGTAAKIGILTIDGNLSQPGTVAFRIDTAYAAAGTDFDQLSVSGTVDLTGSTLSFDGTGATAAPPPQQLMTLIRNTGSSATVTDATTTPAAGTAFALGVGFFEAFYNGGTGNDVVLVDASAPTVAYVSPSFAGDNPGQSIADADFGTAGNQPALFGVNAFATIGAALTAITSSGQVIVNAGTYPEAVGVSATQTLTITNGAAVTVDSLSTQPGTIVQINGTSLTFGDATSTLLPGAITGSGQLIKDGSGTVALAATDSYTGTTTINAGTLEVDGSLAGSVTVAATATLDGTGTVGGNVSGAGTVSPGTAAGVGILTVGGNLTQPGTVTFRVFTPYVTPGVDYDQLVVGGTVDLTGTTLAFTGSATPPGPMPQQDLTLMLNNSGSQTKTSKATTPANGATIILPTASFKLFYNGGTKNDVVLVEASTPTVAYVSPTFAGDAIGQHIADADLGTGGKQPAVFGINAFATIGAAQAAITSSGQVIVNAGTYAEAVSVGGTQTLTVTANAAVTVDSLSTQAGTTVQIHGTSLTFGDATDTTLAGAVTGSGKLVKQGSSTVILSAADTVGTTVNAGTLEVDSTLTGNVTVTSPGMLDGTGTITGNVSGTGTMAPGTAGNIGVLTIDGNLARPGAIVFRISTPYAVAGTDFDQLIVNGTVDLTGTTLTVSAGPGGIAAPTPQQLITLLQNTGGATVATGGATTPAPGSIITVGTAKFFVFYNGGTGHDVVLVDASTPTVAYASPTFAADTAGQVIADADLGTLGNQPAIVGVNAFATIGAALAAITSSGQVIVNAGSYSEAASVTGTQTLTITANAAVTVNALSTQAATAVQINGTSLTIGDATNTTLAGAISGSGLLFKQGSGTVVLSGTDTDTAVTTVNAGVLEIDSAQRRRGGEQFRYAGRHGHGGRQRQRQRYRRAGHGQRRRPDHRRQPDADRHARLPHQRPVSNGGHRLRPADRQWLGRPDRVYAPRVRRPRWDRGAVAPAAYHAAAKQQRHSHDHRRHQSATGLHHHRGYRQILRVLQRRRGQ